MRRRWASVRAVLLTLDEKDPFISNRRQLKLGSDHKEQSNIEEQGNGLKKGKIDACRGHGEKVLNDGLAG